MFLLGLFSGVLLSGIILAIIVIIFWIKLPGIVIGKKDDTYYG